MELLQEIKVLNQPVLCPWTNSAPIQSVISTKQIDININNEETETECNTTISSPIENINQSIIVEENQVKASKSGNSNDISQEKQKTDPLSKQPSQFFHFLRLMQLFPNVHPATLHTVMTLCKNDFFVAVDKLLYAKRCKDLYYQNRRQVLQGYNKNKRYHPYINCNSNGYLNQQTQNVENLRTTGNYCQNLTCIKPQVITLDAKKLVSRNRTKINVEDNQEFSLRSPKFMDLAPVTIQCNLPIRPLSPEDLSSSNLTNVESVTE